MTESTPPILTPKVTLLSWTKNPLETVYSVWEASKGTGELRTPDQVVDEVPIEDIRKLFMAVINQRIPIGEHIDFVFMLENISVSWREQAVRHRIGTLASPERVGADYTFNVLPDLPDSSWWSQSMRLEDMSKFAERGQYRMPDSILNHKDERAPALYRNAMTVIAACYSELVSMGVPMEDARELVPLGAQHRMSWRLNIGSLQHIVGKRSCWILQLGIWGPIIQGMIKELGTKVDPIFHELVAPPCVKGDAFTGCIYHEENRRRYTGDDKHAPCPLHVRHHHLSTLQDEQGKHATLERMDTDQADEICRTQAGLESIGVPMAEALVSRSAEYREFWNRDPVTGKRLLRVVR